MRFYSAGRRFFENDPMKKFAFTLLLTVALTVVEAVSPSLIAYGHTGERFPMAAPATIAPTIAKEDLLESGDHIPDYLRVMGSVSPTAAPMLAKLVRTMIFGGTISPQTKLAMGIAVADALKTPYAAAHFRRLARNLPTNPEDAGREKLAIAYARDLTGDIHGVSDAEFATTKARFNDAQMVELTMVTCFFNYFTRLTAGFGLTPESWLESATPQLPAQKANPYAPARVTLLTDEEASATVELVNAKPTNNWNIGIANSQRAMNRVPDLRQAWFGMMMGMREGAIVPRTTQLQVSLAVSTLNGCRYCTLHQVLGLRKQNVDVAKLVAMKKDDSALTAEEKAAVDFARKLTREPSRVSDADFAALQTKFPGRGAAEVVMQTCNFAFMNRFTDGLRLPSEDEAVKIYKETYGHAYEK